MVKSIKRWKINKKLKFTNASVNCFPGANTSDMKYYIKPPIKKNPNAEVVIIHTDTNDLSSDSTPTDIAFDCEFLASFKNANVSSIYKKDSRLEEKNHRPIRILPNLSEIYERIIHSQISTYLDNILSKYQLGFRQGYSSQQCLLVLIEK